MSPLFWYLHHRIRFVSACSQRKWKSNNKKFDPVNKAHQETSRRGLIVSFVARGSSVRRLRARNPLRIFYGTVEKFFDIRKLLFHKNMWLCFIYFYFFEIIPWNVIKMLIILRNKDYLVVMWSHIANPLPSPHMLYEKHLMKKSTGAVNNPGSSII